jgi:hypothetical protein
MKSKPPPGRRTFASQWDEIGYLYDKLLYWLYQREDPLKARPYARRLARLLPKVDPAHEAIFGEECWSLVFETEGDLPMAIKHRKNEIRLIRRLHDISLNSPSKDFVFKRYGYDDLSDRLHLLAILHHDSGNLDKALALLEESRRLCKAHGIRFDADDMLQEYSEEKKECRQLSEDTSAPAKKRTAS